MGCDSQFDYLYGKSSPFGHGCYPPCQGCLSTAPNTVDRITITTSGSSPACDPPPPSFEDRVIDLAKVLVENATSFPYTWSQALADATDIIIAETFQEAE